MIYFFLELFDNVQFNFVSQTVIFGLPLMLNSDKEVLITLNAQIYYPEDIFCSHEV